MQDRCDSGSGAVARAPNPKSSGANVAENGALVEGLRRNPRELARAQRETAATLLVRASTGPKARDRKPPDDRALAGEERTRRVPGAGA